MALGRFGRRRLLLVAYVSSLVLGLMSAASVNYIMFVVTRTLTGSALAGFTIIVLPLGEADKHGQGPEGGRWGERVPANGLPVSGAGS